MGQGAAVVEETDPQTDAAQTEETTTVTHIERCVLPLDTEKVILRLWSIEDFESIL